MAPSFQYGGTRSIGTVLLGCALHAGAFSSSLRSGRTADVPELLSPLTTNFADGDDANVSRLREIMCHGFASEARNLHSVAKAKILEHRMLATQMFSLGGSELYERAESAAESELEILTRKELAKEIGPGLTRNDRGELSQKCEIQRRYDGADLFLNEEEIKHLRCPPGNYLGHGNRTYGWARLRKAVCEAKSRGKVPGNTREGSGYLNRGYVTFESTIWPKFPRCQKLPEEAWYEVHHGEPAYRTDVVPHRLMKYVSNKYDGAEFRKIWKVASTSFPDYLNSEYAGSFEETPVMTPTKKDAMVVAAVREPIGRWISAAGELLERAVNQYCPHGPCSEIDGFHMSGFLDTLESLRHSTSWFRHTADLSLLSSPNETPNETETILHTLLSAMVEDTACNYHSYASEHLNTQASFLSQNPGFAKPTSLIIKLETLSQGLHDMSKAIRDKDCENCELIPQNSKICKPDRGTIPSAEQIWKLLSSSPPLMQELCLVYAQDFVCFDYELPEACEGMF